MEQAIRSARPDDVPALVTLMAEFYAESGYPLGREAAAGAFGALLADPRLGRIWLAERAGQAVGYVVLTLGFSMDFGGPRGFIDDFFIRPAARREGYGAVMLATLEGACRELGVRSLLVETGPGEDDLGARRFYQRGGFEESGTVFLTRPLAPPLHGIRRR